MPEIIPADLNMSHDDDGGFNDTESHMWMKSN